MEKERQKGSKYIFIIAFLAWHIVPYLLQSLIVLITKHSLPGIIYLLCQGLGVAALFGIGILALKKSGIVNKKEWCYVGAYFFVSILASLTLRGPVIGLTYSKIKLILEIVLFVLSVFLMSCAVTRGLCKFKVAMVAALFVTLFYAGESIIRGLFEILYLFINASILTQLICMLLCALLEGTVINWSFEYVSSKDVEHEWKEEKFLIRILPALVIGGFCLIGILSSISGSRPAARMIENVENRMESSVKYLLQGDLSTAIEEYDIALDYINVLKYVSGLEYDDSRLRQSLEQKDLILVQYLVWEKEERLDEIKNYFDSDARSIDLAIPLLDYYKQLEKETENTEYFQSAYGDTIKDIVFYMMAENQFVNHTISVHEIEKKGKYFEKNFDKYISAEDFLTVLEVLERINEKDAIEWFDMEDLLECANNHPDNIYMQFVAATCGTSFKIDGGKHYEGTSVCINRIVDIFDEYEDKIDVEAKNIYLWATDRLLDIGYYENALEYIDLLLQMDDNDEQNILLAAFCYQKLGQNESCIDIVNRLPEENYYATYYRAMSLIQEKKNNEALEEIIKMCDALENNVDEKQDIETLLYELIQKVVICDWVPAHQYGFYNPESEEQLQIIGQNELLEQYLNAMYYCYQNMKYEEAEKAIERVLELDDELIEASFLAGVIHMEMQEYDESKAYLEKTLECKPDNASAWYVLAHVYDVTGQYREAYECCLKIKELVPSTDHNFDAYGVGYHNNQLALKLERELGVE